MQIGNPDEDSIQLGGLLTSELPEVFLHTKQIGIASEGSAPLSGGQGLGL